MWKAFPRWLLWPLFEAIEHAPHAIPCWGRYNMSAARAHYDEGYRDGVQGIQRVYDEKAAHAREEGRLQGFEEGVQAIPTLVAEVRAKDRQDGYDEGYRIGFEAGRQEGAVRALEAAREAVLHQSYTAPTDEQAEAACGDTP